MPRPVTHPDGSVTVPGAVHGFEAPSWATHRGWICGYVTVAADKVTHSLDSAGKVSRRVIPRQDALVVVDEAMPETTVCLTTREGRRFKVAIDTHYRQVLALFGEPTGPEPHPPVAGTP